MFETLRHLLPDSTAWRLVVERPLKKYLRGVSTVGTEARDFVDDVSDDLWPATTRELEEWEAQFGLEGTGSDAARRTALAGAWSATGGQSPGYIQSVLRAAGFTNIFVYDWFDDTNVAWSRYDGSVLTSIGALDFNPKGFCFDASGRRLYMSGDITDSVYQFDLSERYDLSTAVYSGVKFVASAQDTSIFDVKVTPDGAKMFLLGAGNDRVYEYTLTVPYNVASAVYVDFFAVGAQDTVPQAFAWKGDGTSFYMTGSAADQVHQYNMSTAWDISTASFFASYNPTLGNPSGITFTPDGKTMLLVSIVDKIIHQYNLGTPWNITTAAGTVNILDIDSPYGIDNFANKLTFDHGYLFVLGLEHNDIYRFVYGGPRDPRDFTNQPAIGTTQCGNANAACGEEPPGQTSVDSAVCNRFLGNEVWYLVNDRLTPDAPPPVPDDVSSWPHFWYVGGYPFGTLYNVSAENRPRLERLCLKLGPAEKWIVTRINVT